MCPGSITRYYPSGLQKLVVAHSAYLSGIHFYLPSLQELGNNWISTLFPTVTKDRRCRGKAFGLVFSYAISMWWINSQANSWRRGHNVLYTKPSWAMAVML